MMLPKRGPTSLAQVQWQRLLSSSAPCARKAPPSPKPARAQKSSPTPNNILYKTPRPRSQQPSPSPPPPPPNAETLLDHWRTSWLPLTGAALFAGLLGFYIFGTATASICAASSPCGCIEHSTPTGRPPALTGDNAEQFDKELNWPEWLMGITSLRKRLAERAKGEVLELAMGSGRNLEYYDWTTLASAATTAANANGVGGKAHGRNSSPAQKIAQGGITSFTGLDISADMLDVARRKLTQTVPPLASSAPIVHASTMADHTGGQLSFLDGHLRLVNTDAHKPLPPSRMSPTYDTIIQTFGLCSVSDPVAVLSNIATVVKPETGRIILLEHGKGFFGIVNGLLDHNAGKHFEKYGCWWNRDIEALVEEAAKKTPGLEVVSIERPNILQMGTLVWVELRVTKAT